MIKRVWLLAVPAISCAAFALELNGNVQDEEFEGIKRPVLQFQRKETLVSYQPPDGWAILSAGPKQLIFACKDFPLVEARLATVDVPTDAEDGDALEGAPGSLKALAFGRLPPKATQVTFLAYESLAPMIRRRTGKCYTYAYTANEQKYVVRVIIWELDDKTGEKLLVTVLERDGEPKEELSKPTQAFLSSLFSWEETEWKPQK